MSELKFKELKWTVEVYTPTKKGRGIAKDRKIDPGAYFAVRGRLPRSLPMLHVAVMDPVTLVVHPLFIGSVKDLAATVRMPQAGAFAFSKWGGDVRVVTAERPLTYADLAGIIGGNQSDDHREPAPIGTSGSTT